MSQGENQGAEIGSSDPNSLPKTSRRRLIFGWIAWAVTLCVLIAAGIVVLGPGADRLGWRRPAGASTISPEILQQLQPGAIPPETPKPAATTVNADALRAAMASVPGAEGKYAFALSQLGEAEILVDQGATEAMIPASSLKIMTSISALEKFGAEHKFTTSVAQISDSKIILVGGGDPLLASTATSYAHAKDIDLATTAELATRTAAALQAKGITAIELGFDDSLFAGPVWHPDWAPEDRTFAAPISALVVDEAAGTPDTSSPSETSAKIFADQLTTAGIQVNFTGAASGVGGTEIAKIESAPLLAIVRECLVHSDNFIADILLRQLAVEAGEDPSFAGGSRALKADLQGLGLWADQMQIVDGSGMSMNNRLTPAGLLAAIQLAATRPELSGLLAGLPVGCATGTLDIRFGEAEAACGEVRAKTGALNTVSALVGYTKTADGALVAFALMGNDLPIDRDVRGWFDHVAAAIAACQCGVRR